jgi:hypothetical protein
MLQRLAREYSIKTDVYGIDPLLDKQMSSIQNIAYYKDYVVGAHERGAPDLISLNHYGVDTLWWHFMVYNSITRTSQIVEGLKLRMPDQNEILRVSSVNKVDLGNKILVNRLIRL